MTQSPYSSATRFLAKGTWVYRIASTLVVLGTMLLLAFLINFFRSTRWLSQADQIKRAMNASTEVFRSRLKEEEARGHQEYSLAHVSSIGARNFLRLSPLARINAQSRFSGVIGYFQINEARVFETPVYPLGINLEVSDRDQREKIAGELFSILDQRNQLSKKDKKSGVMIKDNPFVGLINPYTKLGTFDSPKSIVKSKSVEDLELSKITKQKDKGSDSIKGASDLDSSLTQERVESVWKNEQKLARLQNFQVLFLESGHLVFYRNVKLKKRDIFQGFVVNTKEFFLDLLEKIPGDSTGVVTSLQWKKQILDIFAEPQLKSSIIQEADLPAPLEDFKFLFTVSSRNLASQQWYVLGFVLCFGVLLLVALRVTYENLLNQHRMAETQSNFMSSVNHELRTPLTSIRMHSEMLLHDYLPDEKKKKASYQFILEESERLSRLIENVLRFSRMERGQDRLNLETCSIASLIEYLKPRLRPLGERSEFKIEMESRIDGDLKVNVDREAFLQVMINLVDNGIKFSREAQIKEVHVLFEIDSGNHQLRIDVRDFGQGVPKGLEDKVFDLFFRAENELTRKSTGTGIGLALVKDLLQKMNGKIAVSHQNPGVCFEVRLPLEA